MKRTIIVGDIHGCHEELQELLAAVALGADDLLVSVGDLVDRGPAPAEVLAAFRARPGAVVLCGNHERKHVRGVLSYAQEITRLQLGDGYAEARAWMATLPYHLETDEVRVVHAGLLPGLPLAEQREDVLCGSTSGEEELRRRLGDRPWHELYRDEKPVVFGHHVVGPEPLVVEGRVYGIDTGACHGMRLTALCLPGFTLASVPARADHWAETKRRWQVPVLRSRPWRQMPFAEIAARLAELDGRAEPDVRAYAARLRAWIAALEALVPALHAAVAAEHDRILAERGAAGFAATAIGPLLHQLRRGRLTVEDLRARCPSPAKTLELAAALGVTAPREDS